MLVPDFMHEFELGVFKNFFIHLLRILYAHGDGAISKLNERYVFLWTVLDCRLKSVLKIPINPDFRTFDHSAIYPEHICVEEISGVELREYTARAY
jgi:hypothetical protein